MDARKPGDLVDASLIGKVLEVDFREAPGADPELYKAFKVTGFDYVETVGLTIIGIEEEGGELFIPTDWITSFKILPDIATTQNELSKLTRYLAKKEKGEYIDEKI